MTVSYRFLLALALLSAAACAGPPPGEAERWANAQSRQVRTPRAIVDVRLVQSTGTGYEYAAYLRRMMISGSDTIQRQSELLTAVRAIAAATCGQQVQLRNRGFIQRDQGLVGYFECLRPAVDPRP